MQCNYIITANELTNRNVRQNGMDFCWICDLTHLHDECLVAFSIKDVFDNIETHKIIDFIKETRFYKQL